MRRAVLAILLSFATPGLLVPAGLELRLCFCGGAEGGCCHAAPAAPPAGGSCCCRHKAEGTQAPAKAGRRCNGCVTLSVPDNDAVRAVPVAGTAAVAPPLAILPEPPRPAPAVAQAAFLPRWHPPLDHRNLPLLI